MQRTSFWQHTNDRLEQIWQDLSEGLAVPHLWMEFKAETRAGYEVYSRDVDWQALEQLPAWRRPLHLARILSWILLRKLSPARRVLLLLSILPLGLAVLGLRPPGWLGSFQILVGVAGLVILLALELADRLAMKRDIDIAREIQGWLVPAAPPAVHGLDMAFSTRAANFVSGDYYDAFFRAGDAAKAHGKKLLLVVADVVGKGVPAALVMASFQASLQALAPLPSTLDELVAAMNHYACSRNMRGLRFTTAFIAECDPVSGALAYINAGHNAPFLRHASGSFERLEAGGLPLGIEPGEGYISGSTQLAPGDLLVVFTDGVVEAVNEQGEEFGESRLKELLRVDSQKARTGSDPSAAAILNHLMAAVDTFTGAAKQHDDITCLILRAV